MRARRPDSGLTLLEMMVVMAVIGLLAIALTIGYGRLPATALKREAVHLAAILRSGYDRATTSGAHHRVVLDLDKGTYKLERCEGKVEVRRSFNLKEELDRQQADAEKAAQQAAQQVTLTPDTMLQGLTADAAKILGGAGGRGATKCTPVKGDMGQANALGGHPKVGFAKVWVGHLEEPADKGEVTINFFPLGTAEKAAIVLATDEDSKFSILVQPLSGRIDMAPGEQRSGGDFMTTDAAGERQP
jgi:prepilin-type N-terminal cleavage/methylation domain-containing protein